MNTITIIGLLAASLILISQVPQVVKSVKTKQTKDLSLATILLLISGTVLWLMYGFLKPDNVIILANSIMLVILAVLFFVKVRYKQPF